MSHPNKAGAPCSLVVADLFAAINARRKLFHQGPIEARAMASRCTLRFNLEAGRAADFSAEKIDLEPGDIDILEAVVNDQFGVNFDEELHALCAKARQPAPRMTPPAPSPPTVPAAEAAPSKAPPAGLGSRLKRWFGGA